MFDWLYGNRKDYPHRMRKVARTEYRPVGTEFHRDFMSGGRTHYTDRLSDGELYGQIFEEIGWMFKCAADGISDTVMGLFHLFTSDDKKSHQKKHFRHNYPKNKKFKGKGHYHGHGGHGKYGKYGRH